MVSVLQIDLIFQVSIFIVLAVGLFVELKRKTKTHAQLMLAAVVLNTVSLIAVMWPAMENVGEETSGIMGTVATGHIATGGLALLLSAWVVGSWLLAPLLAPLKISCYGAFNKKLMWAILLLWLASLILGFFLYIMINTGLLGSFPVPVGKN